MANPTPSCPVCHSAEQVIPIAYGYPGMEMFEAAQRKEIILGGCIISDESPPWYCEACHESFGWLGMRLPRTRRKEEAEQ